MTSGRQSKRKRREERSLQSANNLPYATPHLPDDVLDPIPTNRQADFPFVEGHFFSGPLPPPEIMAEYRRVDPSFPERIMRMAESEQSHRHTSEDTQVNAEARVLMRSQTLYFIFVMSVLAVCVPISIWSSAAGGVIMGMTTIVGTVGSRMWASREKQKETPKKPDPKATDNGSKQA